MLVLGTTVLKNSATLGAATPPEVQKVVLTSVRQRPGLALAVGADGEVFVCDLDRAEWFPAFDAKEGPTRQRRCLCSAAVDWASKRVMTFSLTGSIVLWGQGNAAEAGDWHLERLAWQDAHPGRRLHSKDAISVEWSTMRVLAGTLEGPILMLQLGRGAIPAEELEELRGHSSSVDALHVHWSRHRAVSGGRDRAIRLWDLHRRRCLRVVKEVTGVLGISIDWTSNLLLASGVDGSLVLWQLPPGSAVQRLCKSQVPVNKMCVDWQSKKALVADGAGKVDLWSLSTFKVEKRLRAEGPRMSALALEWECHRGLVAFITGSVELHDLSADGGVLCVLRGPVEPITSLTVNWSTLWVLSGNAGGQVTFWEASSALESALSTGAGDVPCELQGRAMEGPSGSSLLVVDAEWASSETG